ncbi:hypothetical protein GCM10027445_67070 [Amycolatopsis endophytica]|uniref:Putative RNA polymerase sigma factor n=1 Tax=Amycolatopsis endophytica TaxID=860233 RepID=A0A853BD55_9PSEU|nr:putative RNA polymerase sigma factor [Amycolatopsis endophytica]
MHDAPPGPPGAIGDDRLRLIFTCCRPALVVDSRVALTLRMVGGLPLPEIARAFLAREDAMGRRITHAKAKIKAARIPYRVPAAEGLPFIEARRTARVSASGELVALDEQDRGVRDAALIGEGHRLVRERLASGVAPRRQQILAALDAVHLGPRLPRHRLAADVN